MRGRACGSVLGCHLYVSSSAICISMRVPRTTNLRRECRRVSTPVRKATIFAHYPDLQMSRKPQIYDSSSPRAISRHHSAAVTRCGRLFTWGHGRSGRLGHGNEEVCMLPTLVQGMTAHKVVDVAASETHTAAFTRDGEVYTWGRDRFGQVTRVFPSHCCPANESFPWGTCGSRSQKRSKGFLVCAFSQLWTGLYHTARSRSAIHGVASFCIFPDRPLAR